MVESPIRPSRRSRCIVTCLGWLAQSYMKANPILVAAASGAATMVTSGVFHINRIAYRRIDHLEEDRHGMVCHYLIGRIRARVQADHS